MSLLSFVVPAHDEEALIGDTLRTLRASADAAGASYEIIVVNDASTDRTAAIAAAAGARVVDVNVRQIGAARNAGAKVASGETLVFVDADTWVPVEAIRGVDRRSASRRDRRRRARRGGRADAVVRASSRPRHGVDHAQVRMGGRLFHLRRAGRLCRCGRIRRAVFTRRKRSRSAVRSSGVGGSSSCRRR